MAVAHGVVDVVNDSLALLADATTANVELKTILEHPLVKPDAKVSMVQSVFGSAIDPVVYRFLNILFERNRSAYVVAVAARFRQLAEESKGRVSVLIESAQALTDAGMQELKNKLATQLQKEINAEVKVNPALIAGYRVKVGNRVMDATILGALTQFRNRLSTTASASKEGTR